MNKPNIFDFATKELSQDAFIAWFISHINFKEDHELSIVAKKFVIFLYNIFNNTSFDYDRVQFIDKVQLQYKKIDVYFRAKINDKMVSFIIEDKVNTTHHSNQLIKYKGLIEKETNLEEEVVCIYYKTGYLFDVDKEVSKFGYSIIDINLINKFLSENNLDNLIYNDYKNFIERKLNSLNESFSLYNNRLGFKEFKNDYIQWEFMKELQRRCSDFINETTVYSGVNRNGAIWTQYKFIYIPKLIGGLEDDNVFYRVDKRVNKLTKKEEYYLSLRMYSAVKKREDNIRNLKLIRLKTYIDIFNSLEVKENSNLKFSRINNDYQGANESEICILFFNNEENTIKNVLNEIPKFHKEFVEKVKELPI